MNGPEGMSCPSALDIFEYMLGELSAREAALVRKHLDSCPTCHAVMNRFQGNWDETVELLKDRSFVVPRRIRELSRDTAKKFRHILHLPQPRRTEFGQIWSTMRSPERFEGGVPSLGLQPRIVVVLVDEAQSYDSDHRNLMVAPICLDLEYSSDFDLHIRSERSRLGFEFMIEVWNETPVLRTQLNRFLGVLQKPERHLLGLLYRVHLGADVGRSELLGYVGPSIEHDDDPRIAFQEREVESCKYLAEPVVEAIGELEEAKREEMQHETRAAYVRFSLPVKHGLIPPLHELRRQREVVLAASGAEARSRSHYYVVHYEEDSQVLARLFRSVSRSNPGLFVEFEMLSKKLCGRAVQVAASATHEVQFASDIVSAEIKKPIRLTERIQIRESDLKSLRLCFGSKVDTK